jgi:NADPH:quinone reductase-like Zn-dependent oxidoreductase
MKAIRVHKEGNETQFIYEDVPQPEVRKGLVLIRVHATAVTPTELSWSPTWQDSKGNPRLQPILGHEFSGVVTAVAADITNLKTGDAIYGLNDWFEDGAEAEYVLAPENYVSKKPESISYVDAAAVPISSLTAWQALIDRANLEKGQTVLIHGGAGGVGSFALQIAHWRGARVITTASEENASFVRELGAEEIIDYRKTPFETVVKNVDVVLDTVGGETLERSKSVLKRGGKLVSPATTSKNTEYFFYVQPNTDQLEQIAGLIDQRVLHPIVDKVFPLEQAREAYRHKPAHGKAVLEVHV